MKLSPEQIEKVKNASSAEEIVKLAKENGIDVSYEEASDVMRKISQPGQLSDEELDNASGAGCISSRPSSLDINSDDPQCPKCGTKLVRQGVAKDTLLFSTDYYDVFSCPDCKNTFRRYWEGDEWTVNENMTIPFQQ